MLTSEQKKTIKDIKQKFDTDITMEQIVDEFGFSLYSLDKSNGVAGLYLYNIDAIAISEDYWDNDDKEPWHVFVHEFGHLIHHISEKSNFYGEYKRRNLRFSQILESEQQASLIGLEIWKWKFPNKPLDDVPYFKKDEILWLAEYYQPYFDNDLHI